MRVYTTEIASAEVPSDNPVHQRLLSAYHFAKPYIKGDLLELGCGEGRGVELLAPLAKSYQGIDKIESIIEQLGIKYPDYDFMSGTFPPFPFGDNKFDAIITFHVIEHVKKDKEFVKEVCRVLKPGGVALITTPNIKMTLSRNPWHVREYTGNQLKALCEKYFSNVEMKGIAGNEKVIRYHEQNRKSVNKIMRYDILNLQHKLPATLLRKPYEILNRMNRKKLKSGDNELVKSIKWSDFKLNQPDERNLDLFCVITK
ncbi:MAG: class I SAM-dependent methyltransferase [Ekhidna sp.]|nr:class I SAM-dependent methyltransferase [Ekhidna sp.]MBC6410706.1 class I SAM-dependent methyltransferase [Ekhidna sp.]MBC6424975.1 class I SAM-dependent methyltransferase [Ekhidna sp.]